MAAIPTFTFVDLFAGIGGFHAAMASFGGECVYAVERDRAAAAVYHRNWGIDPLGDLTLDANDFTMKVPLHDVLVAGFPCQPFSKSGSQRGMDEARGTLYWNILQVIRAHQPEVVMLENVPNLAGRQHKHTWHTIIESLRDQGYWVSSRPAVFSPHRLPPWYGGRSQARERVFITATRVPAGMRDIQFRTPAALEVPDLGWDPHSWHIVDWLDDDTPPGTALTPEHQLAVDAWTEFVDVMLEELDGRRLPSFPLWTDTWNDENHWPRNHQVPPWKHMTLGKNRDFFARFCHTIEPWLARWEIHKLPVGMRKLEWQTQDVA